MNIKPYLIVGAIAILLISSGNDVFARGFGGGGGGGFSRQGPAASGRR